MPLKCFVSAFRVLYPKSRAVRVSEIELCNVAMQVLLAAMLINAFHAALEDAVISFDQVSMNLCTGEAVIVPVLAARVINCVVIGELIAKLRVARRLIGHDVAFAVNVGADDW